ncbi:Uncharacterized protein PECH_003971 [Penicillium ucsense]|uniref:Peptidase A1 domain-containing protein n=1 Tax=Penicillium ucsense TaxID=2839758 RepID=A0A8J8VVP9_9EURO|nr:Uncharacterized protein PECM_003548 [Penicillium ucsense]KAF7728875.1 Uncharacterized protein PECH_003971 [Penicillium ucsense]
MLSRWVMSLCWMLRVVRTASASPSPAALVIPPSEYFDGNDGPWSSFFIRVGTPEQTVRVLISTASPESIVVLSEYGCSRSVFETVPADCAVSRGTLFSVNQSTSWIDQGLFGINQQGVGFEANLGYDVRADFGLETLGTGLSGLKLKNQTVAGIAAPEPFYLGIFGLNPQPVNFTSLGNHSSPSFLTSLKDGGFIPSLSWSYTAGAKYRLKQVYGQLIFSGYDTSRFTQNAVSFTMAGDITRDLVVYLQSISYSGSSSSSLLSDPILIFIDSTDPNLWLPSKVCKEFENAFGLTIDHASGLYLVNDSHHTQLLASNAQVSFRLSDVSSGGDTVTITFPYEAFALKAKPPLVNTSSYYFPLRRAANASQYTLGRTFLQEAYLSADYERGIFNVSACSWSDNAQQTIITVPPKGSTPNSASPSCAGSACPQSTNTSSNRGSSLSQGVIAGIAISALVGVGIIAAMLLFLIRRQRQRSASEKNSPISHRSRFSGSVSDPPSAPSTQAIARPPFWSPDAIFGNIGSSNEVTSSDNSAPPQQSVNSRGMELDGQDTQIEPVYYELAGDENDVGKGEPREHGRTTTSPSVA